MKNRTNHLNVLVRMVLWLSICVLSFGIASADNIFAYPDWVLAGEKPPEGYEMVDGEVVNDGVALLATETVNSSMYYITNKQYGEYLYSGTDGYGTRAGLLADLGNKAKWIVFYYEDDGYLIRNAANGSVLLSVPENTSSSVVWAENMGAATYPPRFYWEISIGANGGCILKNKYNGRYLCTDGTTLYSTPTLGTAGTSSYYSKTWRFADYMYYGDTDSYEKRELTGNFSVDTLPLKEGLTKNPQIVPGREDVLWGELENFSFSVSSSNVSVNNTTHKITGNNLGTVTVTATHKVTGRTTTFKAVVCAYEATVYNFYDNGYCVYDGKPSIVCRGDIDKYTYNASLKFAELFGLYLNYGTAQYFESELDKCKGTVTTSNIDTLYECSNNDEAWEDISSHAPGSSTETSIYWTNHRVIWTNEYGVESDNRSMSKGNYILMLHRYYGARDAVLFHELCHQFGVKDHCHEKNATDTNTVCHNQDYGCSECGNDKRSKLCTMYTGGDSLDVEPLLCEDCKHDLLTHLVAHH